MMMDLGVCQGTRDGEMMLWRLPEEKRRVERWCSEGR